MRESDAIGHGPKGDADFPRAIHLKPTAPLAERVLLPGDPHRALAVAQDVLEEPRMFNHTRGLWGYTGRAPDGGMLTVQATGMGGPSAAIVAEELIDLGARMLLRIGTCGALDGGLELGRLVGAETVLAADGTSSALGVDGSVAADPGLSAAVRAAGALPVTAVSTDLFYDGGARLGEWVEAGAPRRRDGGVGAAGGGGAARGTRRGAAGRHGPSRPGIARANRRRRV